MTLLRRSRLAVLGFAVVALMFAMPRLLAAQGDVIRGKITASDSLPITNAQVTVVGVSSGLSKPGKLDKNGVFTVLFPEAEGDYFILVTAIGYNPRRYQVKRMGDEDVINADVRLSKPRIVKLDPIRVFARPAPSRGDGGGDLTGNDMSRGMSSLDLGMMSDPNALAMMLPGATFTPGQFGELGSFSVFGLDAAENMFTLNGLSLSPDGLPRDAGITSSISGSPYDGTRGGFSGGQVDSRVPAGTNFIRRNISVTGYTPNMQLSDRATQSLGNQPTYGSFGMGLAGPIRYNSMFYNIGLQYNDNSRSQRTLFDADPLGLTTAGLAPDSVGRLLAIQKTFGIPATVPGFPTRSTNRSGNLAANFSVQPTNPLVGSFSLTATGNWGETNPQGASIYAMPSHAGTSSRSSGSLGLNHQVMIKNLFYSNTTLGWSTSSNWSRPLLALPSASVRVASALDDGSTAVQSLALGGSPAMAASTASSNVQLQNAVTWMSVSGTHSFRFATQLGRQTYRQDASSNLLGSFTFNSLEDFEDGVASGFTRLLTPRLLFRSQAQLGLAINDQWRPNEDLTMSWSLRMDASRFGSGPERNPLVEQAFSVRNDRVPNPIAFSPRVSFSKFIGDSPQISAFTGAMRVPRGRISGGFGVFQGIPNASLIGQVVNNTGLPSGILTLSCQGVAAPTPNWTSYMSDLSTVPESCANGTVNTVFSSALPSVTLIDPNYNASRSARSDLTWRGPVLSNRFAAAVQVAYALNMNQQQTVDLNFDPTVRFSLTDEAGRPVYVQPSSISSTGIVASRDARVSPLFNRVNALRSDLRSDSKMVSVNLSPLAYSPRFGYSLTYTMQLNRRQVPGSQSTVGNPLVSAWGLNDQGQIHRFTLSMNTNIRNTVRLSYTMMAASGVPVTPRVVGDINGDGYYNDRAFVYDPANTADPALAAAMQTLLTTGSPIARDCLARQLGQLASLGGCRGPWTFQGANELGISINPLKLRMPQRASIQFAVGNPLRGLDIMLHGMNKTHGWGQTISPDQNLLYVRGFDPATNRFKYDVNQRFGSTRPQQSLSIAAPVTITALIRVDIGPTRERQDLTRLLDQGRRNDQPIASEDLLRGMYLSGGVPNPIATMLRQADQLRLTNAQADTLATLDRWFSIRLDSIWTPIARALAQLPSDYSQNDAYALYTKGRVASFDLMIRMAPAVIDMLSPAQKRLLPPFTAMQLDVNYLETIRSSTSGYTTGGSFPIGGGSGFRGPGGF